MLDTITTLQAREGGGNELDLTQGNEVGRMGGEGLVAWEVGRQAEEK